MKTLSFVLAAMLVLVACSDDDETKTPDQGVQDIAITDTTASDTATGDTAASDVEMTLIYLTLDVTYPASSISSEQRAVIGLYDGAIYTDLTQPPTVMPIGALMGTPGELSVKDVMKTLAQSELPLEADKDYVVFCGVAAKDGMIPDSNEAWIAKKINTDTSVTLTITDTDSDWN